MTMLKLFLLFFSFFTANLFAIRLTDEIPSRLESIVDGMDHCPPNLVATIPPLQKTE